MAMKHAIFIRRYMSWTSSLQEVHLGLLSARACADGRGLAWIGVDLDPGFGGSLHQITHTFSYITALTVSICEVSALRTFV
jgi:hypothetical protein